MFVLDTNTVVDYFKGRGKVAERLLAVPPREVALPAIVAYELWVGVLGSQNTQRRQSQYEQFLSVIEVIPCDAAISRQAAEVRHALQRRGEAIGALEVLIAGTALACRAPLVTRNVREFGRIVGLEVVNRHD
jgi:tRNA(fMet)-specific endonuclease VapC